MDILGLDQFAAPKEIREILGRRFQQLRLAKNLTQAQVSAISGVSLASVRAFEQTGEVSLKNLVHLAEAVRREGDLDALFKPARSTNLYAKEPRPRRRATGERRRRQPAAERK